MEGERQAEIMNFLATSLMQHLNIIAGKGLSNVSCCVSLITEPGSFFHLSPKCQGLALAEHRPLAGGIQVWYRKLLHAQ